MAREPGCRNQKPFERLRQWLRQAGGAYVAFAIAGLCFSAATFYSVNYSVRLLGEISSEISDNALRSVAHMAAIRAELHELEHLDHSADSSKIDAHLHAIDAQITGYQETEMYPGEREAWTETARHIDEVRALVRGPSGPLRLELPLALREAERGIDRITAINAINGRLAHERFGASEASVTAIAYLLDAVSFFLALGATTLAYRAIRRYSALLERRTQELDRFADRLAHDVRAQLSPATLAMGLAAHDLPPDHPRQKTLVRGIKSLEIASSIVEALLAFARSGARPEPGASTHVTEVVHEVLDDAAALANSSNIDLHAGSLDDAVVACAPGVLTSVLMNLIQNAVKYMGASRERVIVVGTENDRRLVRVYVQDTGPGVPADVFDTLFDPYVRSTTATAEGLGLGLATVKRLVEAHGGEVGVSSRPGCTRFWFSLPRAADLEDPALTRPASARSAT